jgi:hypothetical protein
LRIRNLAAQQYPGVTLTDLVICIDYTVIPVAYSLIRLSEFEQHLPENNASDNQLARNQGLIQRARNHPGKFTVIRSKVAMGQEQRLILSIMSASIWDNHSVISEDGAGASKDITEDDIDSLARFLGF